MDNKKVLKRCKWCKNDPLYEEYHDKEWGKLVKDDNKLFEFLVLESAQAGLSWITILRKRENYRIAFSGFDPVRISKFDDKNVERLMQNDGIIRNQRKIEATISNSIHFTEIQKEFGSFYNYLKSFMPENFPVVNDFRDEKDVPASTILSDRISKDMKKRGFKFFGTTICYAFLQATGFVNDHINHCSFRNSK